MRILAVDDKAMPRKVLARAIKEAAPEAEVMICANASEVLALPDASNYDVAFLDIDMPGMNGIELAKELKRQNPRVNVVFATGFGEYMSDAFALHSSGYLMKPVTASDVAVELDNLRFPPSLPTRNDEDKLVVRCFGNFEVFANGKPVSFGRAKAKELLALLIDRKGAMVSLREAEAIIWEEPLHGRGASASYLRTLVSELRQSLAAYGHDNVLIKQRGHLGVDMALVSCDYYDYLEDNPLAISSWRGEYMSQYAWAEETKASLYHQAD